MDDETTDETQEAGEEAPAFDPEAFKADLMAQTETRIRGMQRVVSERERTIAELTQAHEQEVADYSEVERDELAGEERAELARLRSENERLRVGSKYGSDVAADLDRILKATSTEEIAELVANLRRPVEPEAAALVGDVDRNNPMSAEQHEVGIRMADGTIMTDSLAQRIIDIASGIRR